MNIFKVIKGQTVDMPSQMNDGYAYFTVDNGKFYVDSRGKDSSVQRYLLDGDHILSDTTEKWNSQKTLVAKKNYIYIYTDYHIDSNGNYIPGIKIGNGNSYLYDLPFANVIQTGGDTSDVSAAEKDTWNNKVTAYLSANNSQTLVLSKN